LDASIKRRIQFKQLDKNSKRKVEIIASVTNVYNRQNIFYFDRINYNRENQLPLLPSLSVSYSF
jgi:hypothetical protein